MNESHYVQLGHETGQHTLPPNVYVGSVVEQIVISGSSEYLRILVSPILPQQPLNENVVPPDVALNACIE
jgi:hypothetical protein